MTHEKALSALGDSVALPLKSRGWLKIARISPLAGGAAGTSGREAQDSCQASVATQMITTVKLWPSSMENA